jgi:hypothetical protein
MPPVISTISTIGSIGNEHFTAQPFDSFSAHGTVRRVLNDFKLFGVCGRLRRLRQRVHQTKRRQTRRKSEMLGGRAKLRANGHLYRPVHRSNLAGAKVRRLQSQSGMLAPEQPRIRVIAGAMVHSLR